MKPPIVIAEGNDISVHPSDNHVVTFLEPQDVSDGVYTAYDSEGWLLDLAVKSAKRERHFLWFRWVESYSSIVISKHEPATNDSAELRRRLVGYLNAISKEKRTVGEVSTASLDELIRVAERYMPWQASRQNSR